MASKTEQFNSLPKEVSLYKQIYNNGIDPIKKEIFSFDDIAHMMNSSVSFPVKASDYYTLKYEAQDREQLLAALAMSYIAYRSYTEHKTKNIFINESDLLYIMRYIDKFYQYDIPLKDKKDENILWVYPKIEIKKFLSDCISNKKTNEYYFDDVTLTKLILIISGFVRYEYDHADDKVSKDINSLNFPTLVLANISLYEKGHLKITDEEDGVGISLDLEGSRDPDRIFTHDVDTLKKKIISVLKLSEGKSYCLDDFME